MTIIGNHTATEERNETCSKHGDYKSVLWSRPKPMNRKKPTGVEGVVTFAEAADANPNLWSFRSKCPKCDREIEEGQDERERERDGTAEKDIAERRLAVTGIPRRFVQSTLKNWIATMDSQSRVKNWALTYTEMFSSVMEMGQSAAFVGTPGTGKTHLAVGIMAEVLHRGLSVRYTTVMEMLGRIKNTYHKDAKETEQHVIDLMTKVDLLVLDEYGKALDTEYEDAQLFRILDKRYQDLKPTIIISNLSASEFQTAMGDAAIDRLQENGGKLLPFNWGSARKKGKPRAKRGES